MTEKQVKKYIYKENLLEEVVRYTQPLFNEFNDNQTSYNEIDLTKSNALYIFEEIKDSLYIIAPNPVDNNLKFIVYELENIIYFYMFNDTREVQMNLKKQYKQFNKKFRYWIGYSTFIRQLLHCTEIELTSRNILLADGMIYDFKEMKFQKYCYSIPAFVSKHKYKQLKESEEKRLDITFDKMYPEREKKKQFFYYILCNLDKDYIRQSMFLIIDSSGVGKTAKIMPMVELGLNSIANAGLLKKSELYNVVYRNSFIFNETQTNKDITGDAINFFTDSGPKELTRKHDGSIRVEEEDRPLLQIMGESLPYIKSVTDGTGRRLILVPKANEYYLSYINDEFNKEEKEGFYDMLYNKPVQMIQYYTKKIKEYNIFDNTITIKKTMEITLDDLEQLLELKDEIFGRYFNLSPLGHHEVGAETLNRTLIEYGVGLDNFLKYIDHNIITTGHFTSPKLRRKYLTELIRENRPDTKTIKDLGTKFKKGKNYYYFYTLTDEGVNLIDEINEEKVFEEKIEYQTYYGVN